MIALVLAFHTMASLVWVGGMFFTLIILRPAMVSLPVEQRLALWKNVLGRFFHWVWISVAILLTSGYGVVIFGYEGFAALGLHIHIMQVTGLIMMALFVGMWCSPWQDFRHAVDKSDTAAAAAAKALARIRLIVSINLPLGLFTSAVGATGGFWTY